jgi:hypothetical protein
MLDRQSNSIIVSCEVFRHEIELITSEMENPPVTYFMEMGLHDNPKKLRENIQEFIRKQEANRQDDFTILLAYGLCGQGMAGITCTKATLVLPKVHDCIPLLLGKKQKGSGASSLTGQTYWKSPGWVDNAENELLNNKDSRFKEYVEKYGEDNAHFLMQEQLSWVQHYKTVKMIKWPQIEKMEERAGKTPGFFEEEARHFASAAGLPYSHCIGSDNYLRALLTGDHDEERFLKIPPGSSVILSGEGLLKIERR